MIYAVLMMQLDEAVLRRAITDLQTHRRWGLRTPADVEKYNADLSKRVGSYLENIISFFLISTQDTSQNQRPSRL